MARKVTKMFTNRCYWVDWICVFNQLPSATELKSIQPKMKLYLQQYLKGLTSKTIKGIGGVNTTVFDEKMAQWYPLKLKWGPLSKPKTQKKTANILTKKKPIERNRWIDTLTCEWDQVSSKEELVFNFKAYFDNNGNRYTAETKGSMTPPPPPPPPGTVQA